MSAPQPMIGSRTLSAGSRAHRRSMSAKNSAISCTGRLERLEEVLGLQAADDPPAPGDRGCSALHLVERALATDGCVEDILGELAIRWWRDELQKLLQLQHCPAEEPGLGAIAQAPAELLQRNERVLDHPAEPSFSTQGRQLDEQLAEMQAPGVANQHGCQRRDEARRAIQQRLAHDVVSVL